MSHPPLFLVEGKIVKIWDYTYIHRYICTNNNNNNKSAPLETVGGGVNMNLEKIKRKIGYCLAVLGGATLGYVLVGFLLWRRRKAGYTCWFCPHCKKYYEEKQ